MPLVALVAVSVLALAPAPHPIASLQVTPASTCDHLVIGVYNPTEKSIVVTPMLNGESLMPVRVMPGMNEPINLLGREGLEAGVSVGGVQLGPWMWRAPADCDDIPEAGTIPAITSVPAGGVPEDPTILYWIFLLGLLMAVAGLIAIVQTRIAHLADTRRKPKITPAKPGKHRRKPDPMSYLMRRQIVRSWIATRRTDGGRLTNDG